MSAATASASDTPNAERAVKLVLATTLGIQLINTFSGIELARGLHVHNRGVLAAAMLWPTLVGNVGALGLEEATTYHIAKNPERVGRLTGSALLLCLIQSTVFLALTAAVVPLVLANHDHDVVVSAWIYSLYVPFNMASIGLAAVLNGLHRYTWFNGVVLFVGLVVVAAQTVFLVLGEMTVRRLVIAYVCTYFLTALYAGWLVRRAGVGRLSADRKTMRSLFSYGIRSHASTVPATLNYSLGQLVTSIFLTATQLGVYVIGVTMSQFTSLIGTAIAKAILPNVASLPDGPERAALARRLVSVTLIMSTLASLPVLILAPWLINIFFGHDYVLGTGVARILLVGAVALSTNRALEAVLRGIGRPLDAGIAEFVALGATGVALAVLMPLIGLDGAALGTLIAYGVANWYMTRRVGAVLAVKSIDLLTPDRATLETVRRRLRRRAATAAPTAAPTAAGDETPPFAGALGPADIVASMEIRPQDVAIPLDNIHLVDSVTDPEHNQPLPTASDTETAVQPAAPSPGVARRGEQMRRRFHPESEFGGFTDLDGAITFYARVQELLAPDGIALDIGCGRGTQADDPVRIRRDLRTLRGKCQRVIGIDVDPVGAENPFVDEFRLIADGRSWPVEPSSIDLAVADFVLEHIPDPDGFFAEAARVLRPGGYLCIRTINKQSYLGVASRLVPSRLHARVLRRTHPNRPEADVFPTLYRCNTRAALARALQSHGFDSAVYTVEDEPSYLAFSSFTYALGLLHRRLAPQGMRIGLIGWGRRR